MTPLFKAQSTKLEKEVTGHFSTLEILSDSGKRSIPVIHCDMQINDFEVLFCDEIYEIDTDTLQMSIDGGDTFNPLNKESI